MSFNVEIGNRVEISAENSAGEDKQLSIVEDILDNNLVLMHVPISYGALVKLPKAPSYRMVFYTEKGLFIYSARIIDYVKEGNFNLMVVELCSDAEKFQRREFFRYECAIEFNFDTLLQGESLAKYGRDAVMLTGVIKDISAGGIRFVANECFEKGAVIKCNIPFNEGETLFCLAKIIHTEDYPKPTYQYQYGAVFQMMREGTRDIIVKYIFGEQRKQAKKI